MGPRYVELAFGCPPIEWDIDMRVRDFADRMGDEYTSLYEKGETGIKGVISNVSARSWTITSTSCAP